MPTATAPPPPRDLPVAVCLPEPLGTEVRAWLEGELGWQVVPAGGPPRPVLTLRTPADARRGCVVVADGDADTSTLRRALEAGAQDALGWPRDRERLPEIARQPARVDTGGPPVWRVAGAGGGVGTSTVALAVAGIAAWAGRSTLAVGGDDLLSLCGIGSWTGPGLAEVLALGPVDGAAEIKALARPVPGVDGLVVLGGSAPAGLSTAGWPCDLVVIDGGAISGGALAKAEAGPDGIDLLVTAPDARAARAAGIDAPLLVMGEGPLDARGVARLAGRPPHGWLPASARVARGALRGRLPAALPGSWLRELRGVLIRMEG